MTAPEALLYSPTRALWIWLRQRWRNRSHPDLDWTPPGEDT